MTANVPFCGASRKLKLFIVSIRNCYFAGWMGRKCPKETIKSCTKENNFFHIVFLWHPKVWRILAHFPSRGFINLNHAS
jgi:hypothetical protein